MKIQIDNISTFLRKRWPLIIISIAASIMLIVLDIRWVITIILTAINGFLVNYRTRTNAPFDFTITVFGLGIVAYTMNVLGIVFYIVGGVIIPTVITGFFTPHAFLFWGLLGSLGLLGSALAGAEMSIITVGVVISVLKVIGSFVLNFLMGSAPARILMDEIPNLALNLIIFIKIVPLFI